MSWDELNHLSGSTKELPASPSSEVTVVKWTPEQIKEHFGKKGIKLTEREVDVTEANFERLLKDGLKQKEIAEKMNLSESQMSQAKRKWNIQRGKIEPKNKEEEVEKVDKFEDAIQKEKKIDNVSKTETVKKKVPDVLLVNKIAELEMKLKKAIDIAESRIKRVNEMAETIKDLKDSNEKLRDTLAEKNKEVVMAKDVVDQEENQATKHMRAVVIELRGQNQRLLYEKDYLTKRIEELNQYEQKYITTVNCLKEHI